MPLDADALWRRLGGRQLLLLESTASTMDDAARLAAAGCASGTAVVAAEQTAGRGRHGRWWHSEADAGLYVSVVMRAALPAAALPVATLAAGLAAQDGVREAAGIEADLRWPNDLMIGGRKAAGVLLAMEDGALIVGIGMNVNHQSFPAGLDGAATSLRLETGRCWAREDLLAALLEALDARFEMLAAAPRAILDDFARRSSYARGRRVVVEQGDTVMEGMTAGLDPSGFLLLQTDDGETVRIVAGGVRPVEE